MSESEASVATRSPGAKPPSSPPAPPRNPPEQHSPRAGHRVVLLAPRIDGLADELADRVAAAGLAPARCGRFHLSKARGIDVERLDGEVNLAVEAACGVVVEPPRRLRQAPREVRVPGELRKDLPNIVHATTMTPGVAGGSRGQREGIAGKSALCRCGLPSGGSR